MKTTSSRVVPAEKGKEVVSMILIIAMGVLYTLLGAAYICAVNI